VQHRGFATLVAVPVAESVIYDSILAEKSVPSDFA
jgi:hypothetical protein